MFRDKPVLSSPNTYKIELAFRPSGVSLLPVCAVSSIFDTISHKGLITKLQKYGIKNDVLNLLKDYLSHGTQQTSINGTLTHPQEVNYGVPQGSVLGPIFS